MSPEDELNQYFARMRKVKSISDTNIDKIKQETTLVWCVGCCMKVTMDYFLKYHNHNQVYQISAWVFKF